MEVDVSRTVIVLDRRLFVHRVDAGGLRPPEPALYAVKSLLGDAGFGQGRVPWIWRKNQATSTVVAEIGRDLSSVEVSMRAGSLFGALGKRGLSPGSAV